MTPDVLFHLLALVSQELWCDEMTRSGWQTAATYDSSKRQHDAIVPYAALSPVDRKDLMQVVRQHAEQIVALIDYPRGPDREFSVDELRVGMQVGWAERVQSDDPSVDLTQVRGTVIEWECNPPPDDRTVRLIRVRWPEGVDVHYSGERSLRRVN